MSDASVSNALRSDARLVVVEAPAGCGKTTQGAQYAKDMASTIGRGRLLILAHTHAACDVFSARTEGHDGRVEVTTIDSLICQIASAYHLALGIPSDAGLWARREVDGYGKLATKVAKLLQASPTVARAVAQRYPIVVCDEHQDASSDQHSVSMACHEAGALLRIFGDPMQRIYGSKQKSQVEADCQRWESLKKTADVFDELDQPHRWSNGSSQLGSWILSARTILKNGGQVDLRKGIPPGLTIVFAENSSQNPKGGYSLARDHRKPVDDLVNTKQSLLVLASHNDTVDALRAFFNRRIPIWEGHVRDRLTTLVDVIVKHKGDAVQITEALVTFLEGVSTGFSPSAYSKQLLAEVRAGCAVKRRGKPAELQALGRIVLNEPDHKGASKMLQRLGELLRSDQAFRPVNLDYAREFWEAVKVAQFDDPMTGLTEIARRRARLHSSLPSKAITTVHKAKGLECSDVLIMPCDAKHFSNSFSARCRLYVAMSRATHSLTLVVSKQNPSPLLLF